MMSCWQEAGFMSMSELPCSQRIRIVSNCNSISTYICSCRCLHNFTNTRILFLAFGCDFFAMLFQSNPHISLQHQHQHHLSSFSN
ncbi:hypothetical protein ACLKA7_016900 [Drosophila subpalustris]